MRRLSRIAAYRSATLDKARSRRFVPESPTGESTAKLEGRFLTAPAFYRYPPGSPAEAGDQAIAQVAGGTPVVGQYTATATGTVATPNGTIIGTSTVAIVDFADSSPPNAPVPNYSVSLDSTTTISWTGTGPGAQIGMNTAGSRAYQIADDGTGPLTGWEVVENYSITYTPPGPGSINRQFLNEGTNLATPGLTVTTGGLDVFTTVKVFGTNLAVPSSGTTTGPAGSSITYSLSGTTANFTSTTPLPALTVATTNPVAGGIAWPVAFNTALGMPGGTMPGVDSLHDSLTTNYGASFVHV
jgi:hypothetical protein